MDIQEICTISYIFQTCVSLKMRVSYSCQPEKYIKLGKNKNKRIVRPSLGSPKAAN